MLIVLNGRLVCMTQEFLTLADQMFLAELCE